MSLDSKRNEENRPERVTELCVVTQCMIDITEKQLYQLRTECSTAEEITRKEICESESNLVRLFGKQLVAKTRLQKSQSSLPSELLTYPHTDQWLSIVGLPQTTVKEIVKRDVTLENLLDMKPKEVERLMLKYHANEEDIMRLNAALTNLRLYTEHQLRATDETSTPDLLLHWSSYKSANSSPYGGTNSPKFPSHQRPSTSSLPPEVYSSTSSSNGPQSPASPPTAPKSTPSSPFSYHSSAEHRRRLTPPTTPALIKPSSRRFRTTPPPQKKNMLFPEAFNPITKSKSHESQLSMKVSQDGSDSRSINQDSIHHMYKKNKPGNLTLAGSYETISHRKRSADSYLDAPHTPYSGGARGSSGQSSPLLTSPKRSPPYKHTDSPQPPQDDVHPNKKNTLNVPVSPTPLGSRTCMKHLISHRFVTKMMVGECNFCHRSVFRAKVCRHCKCKFHRDCALKAAPACGLPNELVDVFLNHLRADGSPSSLRRTVDHTSSLPSDNLVHAISVPAFQGGGHIDSSSTTSGSCNSSTPSSPALFLTSVTPQSPAIVTASPHIQITSDQSHFSFTDVDSVDESLSRMSLSALGTVDSIGTASSITLTDTAYGSGSSDFISTNTSNDSDKSDKTLVDTGSSGEMRPPLLDRGDSQESGEDGGRSWSRVNSISVALREWDIPFEELQIGDQIGDGRFGTVYKGNWHGDVAIKILNMDPDQDNQTQLQAFKQEVAMLRKTRHENLVLFMGACMKPPRLAILTSLCKQHTLFYHIHSRKEKFPMNRIVIIASQIAQGMGYLHAKSIVHKDLKSKNIFIENGKVVITDFGLFNVTKLCHGNRKGNWLSIPRGWLCYLAPEIMRSLQAFNSMDLQFTEASDVYAFGTVWYELVSGEWPFKGLPPEAIIWQVGRGIKQCLGNLPGSRDVKDMLMMCWDYSPQRRPDFKNVLHTCERLPKKRLARCPSHPVQLSRSAESVF